MAIDNYPAPRLPISNAMWRYNAVGGETTLSGYDSFGQPLQYTVNSEQLFLNGVMLVRNVDYYAGTGTTITGLTALSAGDFVEILTYSNFNVSSIQAQSIQGAILNSQLNKSSVTLGSNTVALGDTVSSLSGLNIDGLSNVIHTNRGATNPVSNLVAGDIFWNTTSSALQIYNGTSWISLSAPSAPTIGSATDVGTSRAYNNAAANISFTPTNTGGNATSFYVTSTPGSLTSFGSTSPITITGLSSSTQYTFTVTAQGSFGNSVASSPTGTLTVTSVPQAPTIGTATATYSNISVTFTPNATGGKSITSYTVNSSSGASNTGSSSPIVVAETTAGTFQYTVTATNANGTSAASSSVSATSTLYPAVTGGILASDSTYYYRAFIGSSTIAVANGSVTMDSILIAGGGGGGGGSAGGGGGAGGLLYTTGTTVPVGSYPIVVGSGGLGKAGNSGPGTGGDWGDNGTNSTFNGLTAIGGGGGGGEDSTRHNGQSGGSGGGAEYHSGATPGSGTSGQGFAGGYGNTGYWGGGGGGAGSAGGNSSYGTSNGGNGGSGTNSYASWLSAITNGMQSVTGWGTATSTGYIAGGGGGAKQSTTGSAGSGGVGGGGAGANDDNSGSGPSTGGISGTANTGGGGGGNPEGNLRANLGNGGSGLVIVRYTKASVGG